MYTVACPGQGLCFAKLPAKIKCMNGTLIAWDTIRACGMEALRGRARAQLLWPLLSSPALRSAEALWWSVALQLLLYCAA